MKIISILLALFLAASAGAQSYVKVANENDTFTGTATVRYGSAVNSSGAACSCWAQLSVSNATFTVSNSYFGRDPDPNVVKELDVLETAGAQTVKVNGVKVTVPALPVPAVTPPATYVVTCTTPPLSTPLPATTPATCTLVKQ